MTSSYLNPYMQFQGLGNAGSLYICDHASLLY